MKSIVDQGIQAILPIYVKDKGNCTIIYTGDNEIIMEKVILTVIKNLCRFYHLDLKSSNKTYGDILSMKKYIPIPLDENNIFIQVKTRIPISKHDSAYGYININSIGKVIENINDKGSSTVYLKRGQIIDVLAKVSTVQKSIQNGLIVKEYVNKNNSYSVKEAEVFYVEKNAPVTKGDFAMLYAEFIKIKNAIKL